MDELNSCPFCGENAELRGGEGVASWIICNNKKCSATQDLELTGENAVQMWNTRPAEDALTAEVERLKTALKQIASLRNLNPEMKSSKFSSCAEDDLRNFYCTMGDIAIQALGKDTNAPTKESEGEK